MKPDSALAIIRELQRHGHQAYLVGGCVRDKVMGIEPADYDIATSARPEEIMRIFPRTAGVGAQFGVVLVIYHGHPYEVATFRSDEAYIDGRRPSGVVFTDAKQDVLRRDFTINGLLYDAVQERVIDYVGGQADIQAKVVRAIGDPYARFEEDKLRILRAIRFAARLGYAIEINTWEALCSMSAKIHQVSSERIRDEISRILSEGQSPRGFRMLEDSGLKAQILPEVQWTEHLDRSLRLLRPGVQADFAMAVLLHQTPLEHVQAIIERLKFSRAEMHHVIALRENLPSFKRIRSMSTSELKRFFRLARFEDHLELARIHLTAAHETLEDFAYALEKRQEWGDQDISPEPLLTGDHLISMGFAPGRQFKEILTRVEDEQLEGTLTDHGQAVDFVKRHYGGRA
jgi:poly(A) polymerase